MRQGLRKADFGRSDLVVRQGHSRPPPTCRLYTDGQPL